MIKGEPGPWICDACGEPILEPKDAMVQWLHKVDNHKMVGRDLKLVHHSIKSPRGDSGCYPNERSEVMRDGCTLADFQLHNKMGVNGFVTFLELMIDGGLSREDVAVMMMRIFVPGYEKARLYLDAALKEGVVEPGKPHGLLFEGEINDILKSMDKLKSDDE